MSDKIDAIVTTGVGHPFIAGDMAKLGNVSTDIDVSFLTTVQDAYSGPLRGSIVLGIGTMAHPSDSSGGSLVQARLGMSAEQMVKKINASYVVGMGGGYSNISSDTHGFDWWLDTSFFFYLNPAVAVGISVDTGFCITTWDIDTMQYYIEPSAAFRIVM